MSESPRIYKLNTDIYIVTCRVYLCEPKVGPVHRVASTKGASRTSVGKNGRWVLYGCPARMKEHKHIDRLFVASVCKNHITFVDVMFLNIQNLTYVTLVLEQMNVLERE